MKSLKIKKKSRLQGKKRFWHEVPKTNGAAKQRLFNLKGALRGEAKRGEAMRSEAKQCEARRSNATRELDYTPMYNFNATVMPLVSNNFASGQGQITSAVKLNIRACV